MATSISCLAGKLNLNIVFADPYSLSARARFCLLPRIGMVIRAQRIWSSRITSMRLPSFIAALMSSVMPALISSSVAVLSSCSRRARSRKRETSSSVGIFQPDFFAIFCRSAAEFMPPAFTNCSIFCQSGVPGPASSRCFGVRFFTALSNAWMRARSNFASNALANAIPVLSASAWSIASSASSASENA